MKKLVILLALFNLTVGAQESSIKTIVDSVKYLENTQVKIDNAPSKFLGEWPSYMMAENDVLLLGYAGKKAYDSNLFTTASIHNSLATAYLKNPEELKQVPSMLETAMENILFYKSKETKWVEELDPYDTLQSTIYAGLALSYLIDESNEEQVKSLNQIKNYVLNNKIQDELGTYWKGGVFFAGGTLVRNDLKWRSNAYTTGLVIELLSNMEK
jgi:hypothetical protein